MISMILSLKTPMTVSLHLKLKQSLIGEFAPLCGCFYTVLVFITSRSHLVFYISCSLLPHITNFSISIYTSTIIYSSHVLYIYITISDSDEEEPEPEPVLSENQILQIKNNDPNLVNLTIDMVENGLNNSSTDWAQLGTDIGNHTHLNQLEINGTKMQEIWDDEMSQKFMRGLTCCSSLTHLTLESVEIPSMHANSTLDSMHNLRKLELISSHIGEGYTALGKLLKNPVSKLHELKIVNGDFFIDASNILKDSLENNTTLKKLHIQFRSTNGIQVAWACRNSAIEDLSLVDSDRSCEKELIRLGEVLSNTSLKTLKLKFGEAITTTGWESFNVALRNNTTLTELNLSDNSNFNNESIQNLATVLSTNSTLKTLRLENLRHVTRDGWRSIPTLYSGVQPVNWKVYTWDRTYLTVEPLESWGPRVGVTRRYEIYV